MEILFSVLLIGGPFLAWLLLRPEPTSRSHAYASDDVMTRSKPNDVFDPLESTGGWFNQQQHDHEYQSRDSMSFWADAGASTPTSHSDE